MISRQARLKIAVDRLQAGTYEQPSKSKNFLSISSPNGKNVLPTPKEKEKQTANVPSSSNFSNILFGSSDDNKREKQEGNNGVGNVKKNEIKNTMKKNESKNENKIDNRSQKSIMMANDNKNTPKYIPDENDIKNQSSTKNYFPERMTRVFSLPLKSSFSTSSTTSFSNSFRTFTTTPAVSESTVQSSSSANVPSSSSLSSSSSPAPYFQFTTKPKEPSLKLTENVQDACDVLTLLEICLMHGMKIKEFHGTLPLWTLLERLRLLTHQGIANMEVINSNNNHKNDNNENSEKNEKKNVIMNSNQKNKNTNKNELLSLNEGTNDDKSNNSKNDNKMKSDDMTDSLPDVLRQTLGAVTSISSLKTPLAKARAWIR